MGARPRGKAAKTAGRVLPTCAVALLLAWAFARVSTHALLYSPDVVQGLFLGWGSLAEAVASDPMGIDWRFGECRAAFAAGLALPALGALLAFTRGFKGNVDTGAEHGSDRVATPAEAASLSDRRHRENNIWFSQNSGAAIYPVDRRTENATRGRNLNSLCIAISGMGKTFNGAEVTVLQSVGDALPGARAGRAARIARAVGLNPDPPVPENAGGSVISAPPRKGPGAGFDLFLTDTKGTIVPKYGAMLEAAGFDVAWLNTVRPEVSDSYNPLAYIPAREVDSKDSEEVRAGIECGGVRLELDAQTPMRWASDGACAVMASMAFDAMTSAASSETAPIGGEDAASGESPLADYSYVRTRVRIDASVVNAGWQDLERAAELRLDESLVPLSYSAGEGDAVDFSEDGTVSWRPAPIPGRRKGRGPSAAALTIECEIAPMTVPDGIRLASTVECMATNLSGSEAPENVENGDFWEGTKRLKFMELAAYAFEAYGPRWRSIPTMIDLLDLCEVPSDGGPSPFDILIDEWESGMRWVPPESDGTQRHSAKGGWEPTGHGPHPASRSLAVHCHRAVTSGAEDTVRSVLATCHAAFVKLFPLEVRRILESDDLALDAFGEGSKRKMVCVTTADTDKTFDFLGALAYYQAVSLTCLKADSEHGGSLPRHVRFELDEYRQLGNIPGSLRFFATVRSRNVSIGAYVQSISQLDELHRKEGRNTLFDCVSTWTFMGANSEETLEFVSKAIGEETVYSQIQTRSFGEGGAAKGASEQIQGTSRRVRTPSQLRQTPLGRMYVFHYGLPAVEDGKFDTAAHPLYRWACSSRKPAMGMPRQVFIEPFDFASYRSRRKARAREREDAMPDGRQRQVPPSEVPQA